MMHTFYPSYQEEKASESLWVQSQPALQGEFQGSQGNMVRIVDGPCLKTKKQKTQEDIVPTGVVNNKS